MSSKAGMGKKPPLQAQVGRSVPDLVSSSPFFRSPAQPSRLTIGFKDVQVYGVQGNLCKLPCARIGLLLSIL